VGAAPHDDPRWLASRGATPLGDPTELASEIQRRYPQLAAVRARHAYSSVHDMVEVTADGQRYALKVYRSGVRSAEEIQWEVDLHRHLLSADAPVPGLVPGSTGYIETLRVGGEDRTAVLSAWAPGTKPPPSEKTYRLLGSAAAEIHAAAEDFESPFTRSSTFESEVDQQLDLLRPLLDATGRWPDVAGLGDLLRRVISPDLERGICHNDLTLDNVHIDGERICVFDLDSAGEHWRASEPQGSTTSPS
jgi:Ser/Thr protein kinase RdoA (MazF antagonist)